ncbi:unnamed protein product, partial [Amoebophrya sp. A120]
RSSSCRAGAQEVSASSSGPRRVLQFQEFMHDQAMQVQRQQEEARKHQQGLEVGQTSNRSREELATSSAASRVDQSIGFVPSGTVTFVRQRSLDSEQSEDEEHYVENGNRPFTATPGGGFTGAKRTSSSPSSLAAQARRSALMRNRSARLQGQIQIQNVPVGAVEKLHDPSNGTTLVDVENRMPSDINMNIDPTSPKPSTAAASISS